MRIKGECIIKKTKSIWPRRIHQANCMAKLIKIKQGKLQQDPTPDSSNQNTSTTTAAAEH